MTSDQAIFLLNELKKSVDKEDAHGQADKILLEFLRSNGHEEVAKTYEKVRDKVGFWYA